MAHKVVTAHIQEMIKAAGLLAIVAEDQSDQTTVYVPAELVNERGDGYQRSHEAVLRQAAQLLRHAAAELDAEAQSCAGWRQV